MSLHKSTKGHQQYAYNTTYVYITYTTTCVNIQKKKNHLLMITEHIALANLHL